MTAALARLRRQDAPRGSKAYFRNLGVAALLLAAVGFTLVFIWVYAHDQVADGTVGFDFRGTLFEPAQRIIDGESPYPAPARAEVEVGNPALYPPVFMLAVVPLTLLPWSLAFAVWAAILVGGALAAVRVLGIRDPRCYIAVLLPPTLWVGVFAGNLSVLLIPLAAVAWAYRNRSPVLAGVAVGIGIAAKLYLWPLAIWLLATRRYKAFAASVCATAAGTVGAWAVIGFDGMLAYPDLLRVGEDVYAGHGRSLAAAAAAMDLGTNGGRALVLGSAVLMALVALFVGRRGADAASFSLVVLAAMLGAAIAWPFTFTLIAVPIAIAFPRYSVVWLAPVLLTIAENLPRQPLDSFTPGRPEGVPPVVWAVTHGEPALWPTLGYAGVITGITCVVLVQLARRRRSPAADYVEPEVDPRRRSPFGAATAPSFSAVD